MGGQRALAFAADRSFHLVVGEVEEELQLFPGHRAGLGPAFVIVWALASTGTVAIAATSDVGAAQVWDLAGGECRGVLAAGADALLDVAVSPDGRWAATLNNDDRVFVWDLGDDPVLGVEEFRLLANDYDYEEPIQLGRQVADSHPADITAVSFDAQGLLYTLGNAAIS